MIRKSTIIFILTCCLTTLSSYSNRIANAQQNLINTRTAKGFAVIELYTSEGCSSCPPADELLGKLHEFHDKGLKIYALGYHVDYFNTQWQDRFSDPRFTQRQKAYWQVFKTDDYYTPQMIVNGKEEFLGNDSTKATDAATRALKRRPKGTLTMSYQREDNKVSVTSSITDDLKGHTIVAVLVQKKGESEVNKGENEGRKLTHFQIVRDTHIVHPDETGKASLELKIPESDSTADFEVIGFVQNETTGEIYAATDAAKK